MKRPRVACSAILARDRSRRREEADGLCIRVLRLLTSAATDCRVLMVSVAATVRSRDGDGEGWISAQFSFPFENPARDLTVAATLNRHAARPGRPAGRPCHDYGKGNDSSVLSACPEPDSRSLSCRRKPQRIHLPPVARCALIRPAILPGPMDCGLMNPARAGRQQRQFAPRTPWSPWLFQFTICDLRAAPASPRLTYRKS